MLSPTHLVLLLIVLLLALVVFGPKRLPELARGLGQAIQEFKKTSSSAATEVRSLTSPLSSSAVAESEEPADVATPQPK
jgi:sec-independent protein translocase protein TatA